MKLVYRLALSAVLAGGVSMAAEAAAPAPVVAPVPAADAAPDVVVRALYESYFANLNATSDPSMALDWMTASKPYMTAELAARVTKYESVGEGDINVDMLLGAQDYQDLEVTDVKADAATGDTTTVHVTISNMGSSYGADVKLAKRPEGWRITDLIPGAATPEEFSLDKALTDLKL